MACLAGAAVSACLTGAAAACLTDADVACLTDVDVACLTGAARDPPVRRVANVIVCLPVVSLRAYHKVGVLRNGWAFGVS